MRRITSIFTPKVFSSVSSRVWVRVIALVSCVSKMMLPLARIVLMFLYPIDSKVFLSSSIFMRVLPPTLMPRRKAIYVFCLFICLVNYYVLYDIQKKYFFYLMKKFIVVCVVY